MRQRFARIPIRLRLALGFAIVMAVVLTAIGLFVFDRTRSDLDAKTAQELAARMAGVDAIIRDDGDDLGDPVQDPLGRVDTGGTVQVLGPEGEVVDATSDTLLEKPLVEPAEIRALVHDEIDHVDVDGPTEPLRLIAERSRDDGVRYVAVVGASLSERAHALSSLSRLLMIGGPIALLLASLAAYGVATAALRPVDEMRRRAAEITSDDPGQRLPVGPADDEIAELGKTLNETLARLEDAIESERRFVADASHELRTPLAILKAEIELALTDGRGEDHLRGALLSGSEEVERLSRLADDLLLLARADDGRLPLRPEQVQIEALAGKVAHSFASRDDAGAIAVDVPAGLAAEVDPLRIQQALSNLVDNAIRYGDGDVLIAARPGGGCVEVAVSDSGPGFPADLLARATERFARSPGAESTSGTGLGLAIVESVVAAHGGTVTVANGPGGGAVVTIALPLSPAPAPSPEQS